MNITTGDKITFLPAMLMIIFIGNVAVAGPGSMSDSTNKSQMMTTQQANQMTMHQVMSPQNTEQMLKLMQQMRNNITQMSTLMEDHQMMSQANLSQAAKVMQQMSTHMQELSQQMQKGDFDDKSVAMLNKHNQEMQKMMQQFQQQLESGQK